MKQSKIPFVVKPRNQTDQYFGFELDGDPLHIMPDGTIFHNSGKSVMEQSIIGHVSRYSDKFQLIGVDCKRVEFNLIQGVSNFAHSC